MPGLTTSNEDGTKTNILSTSEDVTLRGIGDVKDTLDCLTGEVVERIGEFVLDGSDDEKWTTNSANYSDDTAVFYIDKLFKQKSTVIMDKIIPYTGQNFWTAVTNDSENHLNNSVDLAIRISKSKLSSIDISGFRQWLSQNPITVQHTLMTESIKTVGLTVINQDGETLSKFRPIEGTMNIATNGTPIKPTVSMEIPVEATNQNLMSFIEEE